MEKINCSIMLNEIKYVRQINVLFNYYVITILLLYKFIIKMFKKFCQILQMMPSRKDLFVLNIKIKYKIGEVRAK